MKATHKVKKGNRPCTVIGSHTTDGREYVEVCLPYSHAEQVSSSNFNGFHVQTLRASNVDVIKIGNEYD